eukprot:XP_001707004.1 Hypothetical protein GL50803_103019 [Giardia lamblia ATCC 50803]
MSDQTVNILVREDVPKSVTRQNDVVGVGLPECKNVWVCNNAAVLERRIAYCSRHGKHACHPGTIPIVHNNAASCALYSCLFRRKVRFMVHCDLAYTAVAQSNDCTRVSCVSKVQHALVMNTHHRRGSSRRVDV